jgi:flagellin
MNIQSFQAKANHYLFQASRSKDNSIANLSSGKKENLRSEDSAAFAISSKLSHIATIESSLSTNLQNLASFTNVQDGILKSLASVVDRMGQIASNSTDIMLSQNERDNYNQEFLQLVDQFTSLQDETFNDNKLFTSGFSDEKQQFIDSLKNNWLKASEDLITQEYGWTTDPTDSWDLIVNEEDTGGYAAFVRTSWNGSVADVLEMQFDLPDFTEPHTQPTSTSDGIVAHEMVHLMQAQNSYFGDLTGDGSSSATWFKEGLAELIRGADNRIYSILGASPTDSDIDSLLSSIGNGNESWTTSEQYGAAFLAARFLHAEIKAAGQASGVKHLTQWMKSQYDANAGAASSGLNAYITANLSGQGYTDTAGFITKFKGTDGRNFVKDVGKYDYTNNVASAANSDTGSIRGSDAGGSGGSLNSQDVVPNATGAPQGSYVEEISEGTPDPKVSADGKTIELANIAPISFGDTGYYNLSSISGASLSIERIRTLTESIATRRANVGSNLTLIDHNIQSLGNRNNAYQSSISRIQDAKYDEESINLAKANILKDFNLATLSQASKTSGNITNILLQS